MTRRKAFTLVELLVVIGIIAVLIGILVPVVGRSRESARRTACAANLRNIGQSLTAYASDYDRKLPYFNDKCGTWLNDLSFKTRDAILKSGSLRETLYCPAGERGDDDSWWSYKDEYAVTGYFWTLRRGFPVDGTQLAGSGEVFLEPKDIGSATDKVSMAWARKLRNTMDQKRAAELELVTDMSFSRGTPRVWTGIPGSGEGMRSNHIDGKVLSGANILFMDGHVDWRAWKEFGDRAIKLRLPNTAAGVDGPDQWF